MSTGAKEYWRVGFSLDALDAISVMSGLVEIEEVVYTRGAVFFYLRCVDATNTIFRSGFLRGTPLEHLPERSDQPLLVSVDSLCPPISIGDIS